MNKKKVLVISLTIVLLLGIFGFIQYWQNTFLSIDGEFIRRDSIALDYAGTPVTELEKLPELDALETLDLRDTGLTIAQYDALHEAMPDCEIRWSVPFQGSFVEHDAASIAVSSLSQEDLAVLPYFTQLETVDANGCRDYDVLMDLRNAYPAIAVHYTVPVGGQQLDETTTEITAENANAEEIQTALNNLPELTRITFTGAVPDNDVICAWKQNYPEITFVWDFTVCGVKANSLDTELNLAEIPISSVDEVESMLPCFYNLSRIDMSDCGIPSAELDALWKRHPETRIVWIVDVGECRLRTDITSFMPYHFGYDGYSKLKDRHTAELKYCVDIECMDMGHMAISDYSFLEYMPKMKYLILADTEGDDFSVLANLKELVYVELFMTSFDQAEVLTGLTKLEDVNIGNSRIDNIEPLLQMKWLKRLWLPATKKVSASERTLLRDTLTDTIVKFNVVSSTDGGWRESPNYFAMRDMLGMSYYKG